jgi:DedD protein
LPGLTGTAIPTFRHADMPFLMGFISSFKRNPDGATRARRPAAPLDSASAETLRARVRRRFIGAAVLVIAAVLVLPLVFESEPRPLSPSVQVRMPDRESAAPEARRDATSAPLPAVAASSAASTPPRARASEASASGLSVGTASRPAPRAEPVAKPASATVRYVIQVGAFAEATAVRETRQRIDKLGLRSTQQDVEVQGGRRTRVRLGPFATREEADRAAARLRAAGLNATLLQI